jgi:hypothetical protein
LLSLAFGFSLLCLIGRSAMFRASFRALPVRLFDSQSFALPP